MCMLITTYSSLLFRRAVSVRVVGDEGCERIHKKKKVQRVKALFSLSQGRGRG